MEKLNQNLRIRCAEAMGWTEVDADRGCMPDAGPDDLSGGFRCDIPAYDTDANAALLLVARLKEQGWSSSHFDHDDGSWTWVFYNPNINTMTRKGKTFELAICAAFLATQGETKL